MKRVLVIGGLRVNEQDHPVFQTFLRGVASVLGEEAEVTPAYIDDLACTIRSNDIEVRDARRQVPLTDFDLIILHGKVRRLELSYVLSRFCAYKGIPYFNDFSKFYSGSKLNQAVVFLEAGAPQLTTIYSMNREFLLAQAEKELPLPFILKDMHGTKGQANYLIKTMQEARERLAEEPQLQFIAQAYCPNDRDYRLVLAPDQEMTIERRGGEGTHLNNTSTGATGKLAAGALPAAIVSSARQVATLLNLSFAGIDIMQHLHTKEYYFIEVNSQPQIFTGVLLDEKAAFMRKLLKNQLER